MLKIHLAVPFHSVTNGLKSTLLFSILTFLLFWSPVVSLHGEPGSISLPATALHSTKGSVPLDINVMVDPGGHLQWSEVLSGAYDARFRPVKAEKLNFGFSRSSYWLRIPARSLPRSSEPLLLVMDWPLLDVADLRIRYPDGSVEQQLYGNLKPFRERSIPFRKISFAIPPGIPGDATLYFRFRSDDTVELPMSIMTEREFTLESNHETMLLGIYYGLLSVMFFYNAFIFLSLREKRYAYYILYILFFAFTQAGVDGLAQQYLFPNLPGFARVARGMAASLSIMFVSLLTLDFLRLREHTPGMAIFFRILSLASFVVALLYPLASFHTLMQIDMVMIFPLSLGGIYAGWISWKKRIRSAIYYSLAWSFMLTGTLIFALKTIHFYIPGITNHAMQMGSSFEVVLIAFALADRLTTLQEENQEAQWKIILEQKRSIAIQKKLTDSFARFVPSAFLELLGVAEIVDLKPGDATEKTMTVLFMDIRNFTGISESMTPRENYEFLNSLYVRVAPIIREHNGFIDKYIGDSIMALFAGHPGDAVASAIRIQRLIHNYNSYLTLQKRPTIRAGIGIHTGRLMLGIIGEEGRMEGTVISDTVNLASRLEKLTKNYGVEIILSSEVRTDLIKTGGYNLRKLGPVFLKGKRNAVEIYETLDAFPERVLEQRIRTQKQFEEAVECYEKGDLKKALAGFRKVLRQDPTDTAAKYYVEILKPGRRGDKGRLVAGAITGV